MAESRDDLRERYVEAIRAAAFPGLTVQGAADAALSVRDDELAAARAQATDARLALRDCMVPGCLAQYDAIAALAGEVPARPEWSGEGWRVLTSGMPFPSGGHICPAHVHPVLAHLPSPAWVEPGSLRAVCSCGAWASPRLRWHGAVRALWEQHLLDVLGVLPTLDHPTTPEDPNG